MQLIKDNKSLAQAISSLENAKKSQKNLLKEHFVYTIDSLNPINVVKEKFLDHIALVAQTDHEVINAMVRVGFHYVPKQGLASYFNHGFRLGIRLF